MRHRLVLLGLVTLLFAGGTAQAIPVVFTFQSLIGGYWGSSIPAVSVGDAVTVRVYADNGGSTLVNQEWLQPTVTSVTLVADDYAAIYSGPFLDPETALDWFRTNSLGQLSEVHFNGQDGPSAGSDIYGAGGDVHLYNGSFEDFLGRTAGIVDPFSVLGPDPFMSHWSVAFVPEPSTMALVLFGLLAVFTGSVLRPGMKAALANRG